MVVTTFFPLARIGAELVDDVVDRAAGTRRHIGDAVGVEDQQRVEVVGGQHSDGRPVDDFAGVAADLVGAVDVVTDELESGRVEDEPQYVASRSAGADVRNPQSS